MTLLIHPGQPRLTRCQIVISAHSQDRNRSTKRHVKPPPLPLRGRQNDAAKTITTHPCQKPVLPQLSRLLACFFFFFWSVFFSAATPQSATFCLPVITVAFHQTASLPLPSVGKKKSSQTCFWGKTWRHCSNSN